MKEYSKQKDFFKLNMLPVCPQLTSWLEGRGGETLVDLRNSGIWQFHQQTV